MEPKDSSVKELKKLSTYQNKTKKIFRNIRCVLNNPGNVDKSNKVELGPQHETWLNLVRPLRLILPDCVVDDFILFY